MAKWDRIPQGDVRATVMVRCPHEDPAEEREEFEIEFTGEDLRTGTEISQPCDCGGRISVSVDVLAQHSLTAKGVGD